MTHKKKKNASLIGEFLEMKNNKFLRVHRITIK